MSQATARQVIDRRHEERRKLVARAREFAEGLDRTLDVHAVVIFGSVARGDFGDDSDVDVLVVAGGLPHATLARNAAIGVPPPRVEFVAWTPVEWSREHDRGNPIALEARDRGLVLRGTLD